MHTNFQWYKLKEKEIIIIKVHNKKYQKAYDKKDQIKKKLSSY